ncbi:putative phage tail protein [Paenibacillus sp. TAB 01]|uniref:putative phage tail protein n=1 Tax=Paenibacillus sp. TAB 01 TaxID=3368988 RepID=UPI0037506D6F
MYKDKVLSNLNAISRSDKFVIDLASSAGEALDTVLNMVGDAIDNLNVDTATWALSLFERDLGLPTDVSKPPAERRARIKFKQRTLGAVNVDTIKAACLSYPNGDVEVDFNGAVIIRFTNVQGTPSFLDSLKSDLEKLIPAHLAIIWEYKFITYRQLLGMTYGQLQNTKYDKFSRGGF